MCHVFENEPLTQSSSPFFFLHPALVVDEAKTGRMISSGHSLELQTDKFRLNMAGYLLGDAGTTKDFVLESQSSDWLIPGR